MDKKYSFLLALLITLLIASNYYFIKETGKTDSKQSVLVSRVIDGDTLELEDGTKVRLLNINSPEKDTLLSDLSIEYMKKYENQIVGFEPVSTDKYGRTLARIYSNKTYINLDIVNLGLASKFLVQDSELKQFANAEDKAIENEKGIWKKSDNFGCLLAEINAEDEKVILKNSCSEINFSGFYIKDESRKIYKFKGIEFSEIVLHSKSGEDDKTNIFWNQENIWNNDRDTLYLFDSEDKIVLSSHYGY